jgi:amidase
LKRPRTDQLGINRREFLQAGVAASFSAALAPAQTAPVPTSTSPNEDLEEITVAELQKRMSAGRLTARELTQKYLERIQALDKRGPAINSVIELNPDALAIAAQLDQERKSGHVRGPLHGIPVLIKDNIGTADRMMTTAGSLALLGSVPAKDAFVARKLREAGAVILGKTNLSEWANFRSSRSTSGWSGRGGLTRNPYVLDRNACGSSSGSGAAASANLCAAAVGTETDGSIVCPSSANGIVGIKPTVGVVSRAGIVPISHSQDTAGPMARTVADAAALLSALAGIDPDDAATAESRGKTEADYTRFLDADGLRGARIGVVRHKSLGFGETMDRPLTEAIDAMKRAGAYVIDPVEVPSLGKFDDGENQVLLYEFKADLNAYLAALPPSTRVRTLKDIIDFNEAHRDQEMRFFGQDLMTQAEAKGPLTTKEYVDALESNHRLTRADGIDAVMDKQRLDALVAPTGGPAWVTDLIDGDHFTGGSSSLAAVAGYPNINVPAGFIFGLPVGISFFGRAYSEPTLIKIAYAFEQATHYRKPPRYLRTADLRA